MWIFVVKYLCIYRCLKKYFLKSPKDELPLSKLLKKKISFRVLKVDLMADILTIVFDVLN